MGTRQDNEYRNALRAAGLSGSMSLNPRWRLLYIELYVLIPAQVTALRTTFPGATFDREHARWEIAIETTEEFTARCNTFAQQYALRANWPDTFSFGNWV